MDNVFFRSFLRSKKRELKFVAVVVEILAEATTRKVHSTWYNPPPTSIGIVAYELGTVECTARTCWKGRI